MAEELQIEGVDKAAKYAALIPQLKALLEGESSYIANLANTSAALKQTFDFWWVGFYLFDGKELVLGPFQGPIACTRILPTKGVCGHSFSEMKTVIVPDVNQFPGHIACSSASLSEIVVPLIYEGRCVGVLDVDSQYLAHFDEVDATYLEQIAALLSLQLPQ